LMRTLLSELRWDKQYCPWLNKNVEQTINHRRQARLNGYAPLTVMTGLQTENPFVEIFRYPTKKHSAMLLWITGHIGRLVEELQKALRRKRIQINQKRKLPNFSLGGYVLVGVPEPLKSNGLKLFFKWRGAFRITNKMTIIFLWFKIFST
jgi:hypothetical protein